MLHCIKDAATVVTTFSRNKYYLIIGLSEIKIFPNDICVAIKIQFIILNKFVTHMLQSFATDNM